MMEQINGKFMCCAGESAGMAEAHALRWEEKEADTDSSVARADLRLFRTAWGRRRVSVWIDMVSGGREVVSRVAVGLTARAAEMCSSIDVGAPAMRDGRARPVGWICVAPVAAVAAILRFREGIKSSVSGGGGSALSVKSSWMFLKVPCLKSN